MPIFDYACAACGRHFEKLVRTDTVVACPQCESREVTRRLSLPARPVGGSDAGAAAEMSCATPPAGGCCGGACHVH